MVWLTSIYLINLAFFMLVNYFQETYEHISGTHFKVVLLHSYLWRKTLLSMSIKSPNRCMGVSRLRISLFKDGRSYYPSHSTLPNTDSFIRNFSIYRVGVAKVQYLAKHIKRDKGGTANRSAAWWNESLRKVLISVFLIPPFVYFCVFPCLSCKSPLTSFFVLVLYDTVEGFLVPLDVWHCFACVNEKLKQRFSSLSVIGFFNCWRRPFIFISLFLDLLSALLTGSATWLRPYSV